MRILVTGATGLVGTAVCRALLARGDRVRALSRGATRSPSAGRAGVEGIPGDLATRGDWATDVRGCDAVVHLAGASIGGRRWTGRWKTIIVESRIHGTRNLVAAIAEAPAAERPRVLISASGIDAYPFDDGDHAYGENASVGTGFLADLCAGWEREAQAATTHGVRVACLRTGLVLAREAEAVRRMALPFRLFVGGPVGSGKQWTSFIHVEDLAAAYLFLLDRDSLAGPQNAVAPGTVRAREFAKALGRALHRPSWLPVPCLALRVAVGEIAPYLCNGRRAAPVALERAGFRFRYPEAGQALVACFAR